MTKQIDVYLLISVICSYMSISLPKEKFLFHSSGFKNVVLLPLENYISIGVWRSW